MEKIEKREGNKVKMTDKLIKFPDTMIAEINDSIAVEGYTSFNDAVRSLVRTGLRKVSPAYVSKKTPPKTPLEKIKEKKQADKYIDELERKELLAKVKKMGGEIVDKDGRPDAEGGYIKYKTFAYVPGNPPRIAIGEEKNPLSIIDEIIDTQYSGATKNKIDEVLASGNYEKIK